MDRDFRQSFDSFIWSIHLMYSVTLQASLESPALAWLEEQEIQVTTSQGWPVMPSFDEQYPYRVTNRFRSIKFSFENQEDSILFSLRWA